MSNSKFPIIAESDPPFLYGRDLTRIAFLIVLAFSGGMTIFFIKFKYSDQLLERAENSWTLFFISSIETIQRYFIFLANTSILLLKI